ncbi:MAG TPA: MFS transporter [Candidatus Acidoferrum sp.]|jgi:ACS family glucarate transporter-like MFS transporter
MIARGTGKVRWFLVFWLFVLSAVSYLDRVNISIAGSSIAEEFHLQQTQLGLVFSAFLIGYALFQTPGGWLADRLGPRRVLTAGVAWWGVFTALTAAVSTTLAGAILLFVLVRFLLGAGEAIIFPASNQFVSRWIPTQERGIANGLIFAGVGAGAGAAPVIVTYIMVHYGWRASFWVSAVLGLLVGAVWFVAARDNPEEHSHVSATELKYIEDNRTAGIDASATRDGKTTWKKILRSKEVWGVTLSYFCFGYVAWIFFSWFYIYLLKVRGLDLKASAFYSTIPPIAMVTCSLLGGAISDALTKSHGKRVGRCSVGVFSLLLAGFFLVLGSHAENARLASVVLSGGAGALYLSQSSYWSVTADIAGRSAGAASGFMNMGGQLGGALTASLTPAIAKQYGWNSSFHVAAALSVMGALAWLLVDPNRRLPQVPEIISTKE